jgi:uncharacterized protein involved in exopolysaccharide biosynthesis
MQKREKSFSAADFLGVILRRKRVVLTTAAAVSTLVFVIALALPDSFKGQTLLMIDPSKFPDQFANNVKWFPPVDERLETLFQAAKSRRELRAICDRFGLFRPEDEGALMRKTPLGPLLRQLLGDAPERLGRELTCDVMPPPPNRPKEQRIIQVAFRAGEPKLAADVTNAFAFRLADIEHEFSLAHFDEAIAFLETSARTAHLQYEAKSRELLEWKQLHEESLPEHAADLRHQLETFRAEKLTTERAVSEAESRIDGYARTVDAYVQQAAFGVVAGAGPLAIVAPGLVVDRRLEVLRTEIGELTIALADLKIRDFDEHPDVRRVSALLAAAQAEYKALAEGIDTAKAREDAKHEAGPAEPKDPSKLAEVPPGSPLYPAYEQVVNLRESEKKQVEILRRELVRLEGEEARVSLLLAREPETERVLAGMIAEADALRKVDDERRGQLESTRTMREVEKERKSEQLRVIEPAEASPVPDGPDRLKIAILGVVLALGAGAGGAFLKESRDTSFRSAEDAAEKLEAPVLVAIPKIGA